MITYQNPRRYMLIFLLCFAGIAALEITAFVIKERIIGRYEEVARFERLGDAQRTQSLRTALLITEYVENEDPSVRLAKRKAIEDAVAEMRRLHGLMTEGDPENGYPVPDSETVDQIIFGAPIELDKNLRLFLSGVEEMVDRPWSDDLARLPYMTDIRSAASGSLATGLNRLNEVMREAGEEQVNDLKVALVATSAVMVLIIGGLMVFVVVPMIGRMGQQTEDLIELARTDPLTGCHNRRSFLREADAEFARFKRYRNPFAVIMIDLDHFKKVNDTFGHAAGDEVIRTLARVCLEQTRLSDVLGRVGGEEFAILVPEINIDSVMLVAEKLRSALEQASVEYNGQQIDFTASLGVTVANEDDEDFLTVLTRADEALYAAKDHGRNRVERKLA